MNSPKRGLIPKIGASTPYDFSGRHLTAYGGLLPIATMLEKLWIPATGGRDAHGQTAYAGDARLPVCSGDGDGVIRGVFTAESSGCGISRGIGEPGGCFE